MFSTLKYDPETDEVQYRPSAYDPETARTIQHQACDRCHEKKVKCNGEKGGCERCLKHRLRCEYTRSASRQQASKKGRRSGESSRKSGDSSLREGSSARSSASHSRSPKSPRPSHSSHSSGRHHHQARGAVSPVTSGPVEEAGILGSLDDYLRPEDAFDMRLIGGDHHNVSTTAGGHGAAVATTQPYHQPDLGGFAYWPGQEYANTAPGYSGGAGEDYGVHEDYVDYQNHEDWQTDPRYWSQGS